MTDTEKMDAILLEFCRKRVTFRFDRWERQPDGRMREVWAPVIHDHDVTAEEFERDWTAHLLTGDGEPAPPLGIVTVVGGEGDPKHD